jgi:hypothetical protein
VRREKASPAANEGVVAVDGPIEASPFLKKKPVNDVTLGDT